MLLSFAKPLPRGPPVGGRSTSGGRGRLKLLLLIIPCVLAVWVPLYNIEEPSLFGLPFFYWFQLLLIPVSALGILAADRIGKSRNV